MKKEMKKSPVRLGTGLTYKQACEAALAGRKVYRKGDSGALLQKSGKGFTINHTGFAYFDAPTDEHKSARDWCSE